MFVGGGPLPSLRPPMGLPDGVAICRCLTRLSVSAAAATAGALQAVQVADRWHLRLLPLVAVSAEISDFGDARGHWATSIDFKGGAHSWRSVT